MAYSVQMPALGESVTEGTVTRWLKQEGDQVEVDEPLLEVSTDKVDTEIPSPAAGVLQRIVAGEDETVEVGGELAVIGDGSDDGGGADDGSAAEEEAPAEQDSGADEPAEDADDTDQDAAQPAATQSDEPAEKPKADTKSTGSGTAVTMPELGESVTEGTVTRWLKQVGDQVEVDEPLLEVSTDKVDTEIPSPVAGTLLEIIAAEDDTVDVGGKLAVIGDESADSGDDSGADDDSGTETAEAEPEPAEQKQPEPEPAAEQKQAEPEQQKAEPEQAEKQAEAKEAEPEKPAEREERASTNGKAEAGSADVDDRPQSGGAPGAPYVTPLVRKLAAEHDVDLGSVSGTGVGGRIRKQDVLAAAEKPAAPAPAAASRAPATRTPSPAATPDTSVRGRTEKLSRLRAVIARRMVESLQVSAQLTTVVEADVTKIARLRQQAKGDFESREGVKLSFLPFFAKAAIEALKAHPSVNSSIDQEAGTVTYHDTENLGIAVDTERGLLVPVIHEAGDLSLGGIARKIADLAERTRTNKITPDELGGGTFTLTNTGSRGALFDTPIINQPQVAILGVGSVVKRPVVVQDAELGEVIAIRSMVYLALTYDHRIVDGADAARFLTTVRERLEAGQFEGELGLA
jgi:pyruvate dehydrogenase E2 component (dihydrolipoamide acetyltransferase)